MLSIEVYLILLIQIFFILFQKFLDPFLLLFFRIVILSQLDYYFSFEIDIMYDFSKTNSSYMNFFGNTLLFKIVSESISIKIWIFDNFFNWLINKVFVFVSLNKREKF